MSLHFREQSCIFDFFPTENKENKERTPGLLRGARNFCPHCYRTVCLTSLEQDRVVGVHCKCNPSDLTWVCRTICPAGLVSNSLLASQGHQEHWELPKTKFQPGEISSFTCSRYLKANQFSENTSISELIYIWIYVGLTKSLKQRIDAVGKTASAAHSNDLVWAMPNFHANLLHAFV